MRKVTSVLRELRDQHRKTQEYMAGKLSISQSQYNKIEKGEKPLEFDRLVEIAKIFNIQPKQLFVAIFEEENVRPSLSVVIDTTKPKEESQESYYKKMASYFEDKFLNTYRMYIEMANKHRLEVPEI